MGVETDTLHQPFFFVNKTAKSASLSHGKADEAFFIQSYVQSRVRKQKRCAKERYRICVSPKLAASTMVSASPEMPATTPSLKSPPSQQRNSSVRQHSSTEDSGHQGSAPAMSMIHYSQSLPAAPVQRPLSPSCLTLDEKTYALLQYPLSNFIVVGFAAESLTLLSSPVPRTPFRHQIAVVMKLQHCMQDEMLMYSALANSASCVRWAVGGGDGDADNKTYEDDSDNDSGRTSKSRNPQGPDQYMLKAIGLLKTRLAVRSVAGQVSIGLTDQWCISCMHDLGVAELWNGDQSAAATHLHMLTHVINSLGGLGVLDPYMLETLILVDKYLALSRGKDPLLPITSDLELPASPFAHMAEAEVISATDDRLHATGSAFFGLGHEELGPALVQLICETISLVREADFYAEDIDKEHHLFLRHQILFYRVLQYHPPSENQEPLQNMCRLALLMWLLKITSSLQSERAAKALLPDLREALISTSSLLLNSTSTASSSPVSCRYVTSTSLWATTVGARVAEFMDERTWFIQYAAALGKQLHLPPEKPDYAHFLERYFYLPCEEGLQFKRMVRVIKEQDISDLKSKSPQQ